MTLNDIMRAVCRSYGVTRTQIRGEGGFRRPLSQARAAFCYWARMETTRSYGEIALFCHLDHSTVKHHARNYPVNIERYGDDKAALCEQLIEAERKPVVSLAVNA